VPAYVAQCGFNPVSRVNTSQNWRRKCLTAAPHSALSRYQTVVEALRAKACLLQLQQAGQRFTQRAQAQPAAAAAEVAGAGGCGGLYLQQQQQQQQGPRAASGCIRSQQVALGTLSDAWVPHPLLDFERDLSCKSEQELEELAQPYVQAASHDPQVILKSLQVHQLANLLDTFIAFILMPVETGGDISFWVLGLGL
jgi:hypothetical protein